MQLPRFADTSGLGASVPVFEESYKECGERWRRSTASEKRKRRSFKVDSNVDDLPENFLPVL